MIIYISSSCLHLSSPICRRLILASRASFKHQLQRGLVAPMVTRPVNHSHDTWRHALVSSPSSHLSARTHARTHASTHAQEYTHTRAHTHISSLFLPRHKSTHALLFSSLLFSSLLFSFSHAQARTRAQEYARARATHAQE